MTYRRDRVVWGAVLFRTINPEVVEGAIVRRSERLHWSSEEAKEGRLRFAGFSGYEIKGLALEADGLSLSRDALGLSRQLIVVNSLFEQSRLHGPRCHPFRDLARTSRLPSVIGRGMRQYLSAPSPNQRLLPFHFSASPQLEAGKTLPY